MCVCVYAQAAKLRVTKNGGIETHKQNCQSVDQPHIYAAGDATLDIGLVSVAEMEGRAAVEHMFACKVCLGIFQVWII